MSFFKYFYLTLKSISINFFRPHNLLNFIVAAMFFIMQFKIKKNCLSLYNCIYISGILVILLIQLNGYIHYAQNYYELYSKIDLNLLP